MKDKIELEIDEDGTIRTIHQEGIENFAAEMGGEISTSCRASNVEWEESNGNKGWTVRSAYDNDLAIRWKYDINSPEVRFAPLDFCVSKTGDIAVFPTREEAIVWELKFFWELLAPRNQK